MFNLDLIKEHVKVYGSPLFNSTPSVEAGVVKPGEYTIDGDRLFIETEQGSVYIPIRSSRKEAGVADNQEFNIGLFEALRDASGVYNNNSWTITKGELKPFAY